MSMAVNKKVKKGRRGEESGPREGEMRSSLNRF